MCGRQLKHNKNTMELYQSIRTYYLWIGMNPPPKSNRPYLYGLIKIFVFSSLTIAFILVAGFFLFEAESIVEYGFSFYISSAVLLNLFLTYLEMPNTLKLIQLCEHFVQLSKWRIGSSFKFYDMTPCCILTEKCFQKDHRHRFPGTCTLSWMEKLSTLHN